MDGSIGAMGIDADWSSGSLYSYSTSSRLPGTEEVTALGEPDVLPLGPRGTVGAVDHAHHDAQSTACGVVRTGGQPVQLGRHHDLQQPRRRPQATGHLPIHHPNLTSASRPFQRSATPLVTTEYGDDVARAEGAQGRGQAVRRCGSDVFLYKNMSAA